MRQVAPDPAALRQLVGELAYKPGWRFTLDDIDRGQGSKGLTLCILIDCPDSYQPQHTIRVAHYMIVPAASYNRRSWQRWLFQQILLVEQHEAAEFFRFAVRHSAACPDGQHGLITDWDPAEPVPPCQECGAELVVGTRDHRPYSPLHGPGNDPYLIAELATDEDRRISFRGELNPESP
jgi:hypothetical protein